MYTKFFLSVGAAAFLTDHSSDVAIAVSTACHLSAFAASHVLQLRFLSECRDTGSC